MATPTARQLAFAAQVAGSRPAPCTVCAVPKWTTLTDPERVCGHCRAVRDGWNHGVHCGCMNRPRRTAADRCPCGTCKTA